MRLLNQYHWPGNVRELENVLQRAKAFCETTSITPVDLPATVAMTERKLEQGGQPEDDSLKAYEKLALENALEKCEGGRRCAAKLLGIGEATLYRKMKEYGLSK